MNNTFLENKLKEFDEFMLGTFDDGLHRPRRKEERDEWFANFFHETVEWVKGEVVPEEVGVFDGGYEEWKPRGYSEWRDDVLSRFQTITGKEK